MYICTMAFNDCNVQSVAPVLVPFNGSPKSVAILKKTLQLYNEGVIGPPKLFYITNLNYWDGPHRLQLLKLFQTKFNLTEEPILYSESVHWVRHTTKSSTFQTIYDVLCLYNFNAVVGDEFYYFIAADPSNVVNRFIRIPMYDRKDILQELDHWVIQGWKPLYDATPCLNSQTTVQRCSPFGRCMECTGCISFNKLWDQYQQMLLTNKVLEQEEQLFLLNQAQKLQSTTKRKYHETNNVSLSNSKLRRIEIPIMELDT